MKSKRKKVAFGVLIIILVSAAIVFFQFNTGGYLLSVPYRHSFVKIADNVYINRGNKRNKNEIIELVEQAKERDRKFFGELKGTDDLIIIVFDDEKLISKIGDKITHTLFFPNKKSYSCIYDDYFCIDIVAHEITHAELHSRLDINALKKLPTWFDEGIALQNDYREQYDLDSWIEKTDNGKNTIALEDMDEASEFYAGTADDRRFRYINAKYEVNEWMEKNKQQGLIDLIDRLNKGEDFKSVYGK